jgi:general nucleoside transport system permease protein
VNFVDGVLGAATLLAPVLVLTGLGGVISQRSGVVNVALEGFLLIGAFVGIVSANAVSNGMVGLAAGAVAGGLTGWMFSFLVTRLRANMIIVGLGLNTVILGLVGLVLSERYGSRSSFRPDNPIELPSFGLGFLADVPVLGPLLSSNNPVVWATAPLVAALSWALVRTRWGLRLRAAGGDPAATTALGIGVTRVQQQAGLAAGALAGLGGAYLSIGVAGIFSPGISGGRGYIALAAVYFGRARPLPTTIACVIYAVFDATQVRLKLRLPDIPVQLLETLPYLAVIVALTLAALSARRSRAL